jgi:thioredoxin reductase
MLHRCRWPGDPGSLFVFPAKAMNVSNKIIIIGAGPYGLSLAAHLRARGIGFRIFGKPMSNWQHKMPRGMLLKSEGFASNLADPGDRFTLEAYCRYAGVSYAAEALPVSRESFIDYGKAFQQRFVPDIEERLVTSVRRSGDGFAVQLEDGEIVAADKIVIGIGISDFAYLPPSLAGLPPEFMSHVSRHEDMDAFRGRAVAVIGGGSSAIDIAALLHEAGASVQLITRRAALPFHSPPEPHRSLTDRLRAPMTGIGPGWRSTFYTRMPQLFHSLPPDLRMRIVSTWLGPAGGWYMRDRVVGRVPCLEGYAPQKADISRGKVRLRLARGDGSQRVVSADHVIAATGYRVDFSTVGFIDPALRAQIDAVSGLPVLSRDFETSVAGLYLVGPASAYSFGPMFRFVLGTRYTARRLARHLAGASFHRPFMQGPALATR